LFGLVPLGRRRAAVVADEAEAGELRLVPGGEQAVAAIVEHSVNDIAGSVQAHPDQVILQVQGLSKSFGGVTAVRSASLELHRGETFGLIGPNGSGKTTMLNLLSGVYTPDSGSARWPAQAWSPCGADQSASPPRASLVRSRTFVWSVDARSPKTFRWVRIFVRTQQCCLVCSRCPADAKQRETRELVGEALDLVDIRSIADVDVDTFHTA
jgi:ABC-type branched-subunit amino acid transport system ATPase component